MPRRVQGESICYGPDGKTLYLTSECKGKDPANPAPLLEVPVTKDLPAAAVSAPPPKPKPAPATQPPAKAEPLSDQQQINRRCKGWFSMAESYLRSGMTDKARLYFQKIVDGHPETPWAAKARERLEKIDATAPLPQGGGQ